MHTHVQGAEQCWHALAGWVLRTCVRVHMHSVQTPARPHLCSEAHTPLRARANCTHTRQHMHIHPVHTRGTRSPVQTHAHPAPRSPPAAAQLC